MQNDFVPIHLKESSARLDKDILSGKIYCKHKIEKENVSLWQNMLKLFKLNIRRRKR